MIIVKFILLGILMCLLLMVVFSFFMLIRNEWVRMYRNKIIDTQWANYRKLPSYETMLWEFWKWNYDDVLKGGK